MGEWKNKWTEVNHVCGFLGTQIKDSFFKLKITEI